VKKQAAALRHALVLEMHRGTDPKEPHVQALVKQLEGLSTAFLRSRGGMQALRSVSGETSIKRRKADFPRNERSVSLHLEGTGVNLGCLGLRGPDSTCLARTPGLRYLKR
jgi:hypothetical protein